MATHYSNGKKRKRTNDADDAVGRPEPVADPSLLAFASLVTRQAEVLAGMGDGTAMSDTALAIAKQLFDQALAAEPAFLAHAALLYKELVQEGIQTRAKSRKREAIAAKPKANPLLQPTPLAELFTEGMPDQQIWEQLDMRAGKVGSLVSQIVSGGDDTPGIDAEEADVINVDEAEAAGLDDDDSDDDSGDDSEGSDSGSGDSDPDEFGLDVDDEEEEEEVDDEEEELSDAEISFTKLRDPEDLGRGKRLSLADLDEDGPAQPTGTGRGRRSAVDDDFFSLDAFLRESEQGEREMTRLMEGVPKGNDDDDDDDLEGGDGGELDLFAALDGQGDGKIDSDDEEGGGLDLGDVANIGYEDFYGPPPAHLVKQRQAKAAKGKGKGRPSPVKPQPQAVEPAATETGDRRVRFSEQVKVKPIAARRGSGALLAMAQQKGPKAALEMLGAHTVGDAELEGESDDDEEEDGDVEMEELEDEAELSSEDSDDEAVEDPDQADEAIEGLKDDLFADDDDKDNQSDQEEEDGESRYERRVKALRKQIAELEAENVAQREWTMRGEAKSKERPMNSLLEEDLDFEQVAKVVPVVTAEATASLEERIKKRILEGDFDDVVRRRTFDPAAYLPSRLLNIPGTQSDKSLAELYEDEYSTERQRAEGREIVHEVDARLEKGHKEIENLFDDLCSRLDALSNARFTPKAPQTAITTINNQPAISLESALPSTSSAGALLAPEEVFAPGRDGTNGADKAELTPNERKAARQRNRRQRAARQAQVDKLAGQRVIDGRSGKGKGKRTQGDDKVEKQAALNKLVGTRGVTVIGKPSASTSPSKHAKGKTVQREEAKMAQRGSAALKL